MRTSLGLQLSAITGLQILASFGMQWYVVTLLGAGAATDALYAGAVFPQVATVLLIESLTSVIVPLLAAHRDKDAEQTTWLLLSIMTVVFSALTVVLYFSIRWLIPLLVPGFAPATKALAMSLARVQVLGLVFGALTAPLSALCQVRSRFRLTALSSLAGLAIGCLLLVTGLKRFGIELAAWAQVVATGIPTLILLPFAGRIRVATWQPETMRIIYSRVKPLVFSKGFYMLSIPVDRFLASFLAPGSIVVLELANRFYTAVLRVLTQGVLTPFLPTLSRYAHENRWAEFRRVNRRQVLFMAIPASLVVVCVVAGSFAVMSWASAQHGIRVAGNLTADKVGLIALVLVYMSGLVPAVACSAAYTSAFFAQGDTRTPARIGVAFFIVGFACKVAGFFLGGLKGIAFAVTLWAIGQTAVTGYLLQRKLEKLALVAADQPVDQSAPTEVLDIAASL
jgi:putative peptidoglycan lipid II flippase